MPLSSKLRSSARRAPSVIASGDNSKFHWEKLSHLATIVSSLAAAVALAVSSYQFRESLRVQENSVFLQNRALQTERAAKAAELFEKYLEIRSKTTALSKGPEREQFYFERNNRALIVLNALFATTKGDDQWESIVFWSLQRFQNFAQEKKVLFLSLTDDFQDFMVKAIPNTPNFCRDFNDSE